MNATAFLPLLLLGTTTTADRTPPAAKPLAKSIDGLPIGAIPQQALPASGCAVYLWSAGPSRALVAMASADPAQLRLSIGGTITDIARSAQREPGGFGFSGVTEYRSNEVTAVLDMTIATRGDLKDGAAVPAATLSIERPGQDGVVLPVAGLIGCV